MSKYGNIRQVRPQDKPRPWKIHPIWQGFGCIMIIVMPIVAYAAADKLIEAGALHSLMGLFGVPVPYEAIMDAPANPVPELIPFGVDKMVPHLYGNLALAAVLTLIAFGIFMIFYTIMYYSMGPSRLGPMDAEVQRRRPRQSSAKRRR